MWDFVYWVLELLISFQGILTAQLRHLNDNAVTIPEFLLFSYFFCHFSNFLIKKINFWFWMCLKLTIITTFNEKNIIIVCSKIPFNKSYYHIETSQLIWKALQLTGFYIIRVFSERCFRIDFKTAFVFTT